MINCYWGGYFDSPITLDKCPCFVDIINAAKKTTQAFKAAFILFGLS